MTTYSLPHTASSSPLVGRVHVKALSEGIGLLSAAFTMIIHTTSLARIQEEGTVTLEAPCSTVRAEKVGEAVAR